jgi:hypothetical protein
MKTDIEILLNDYYSWLKSETETRKINQWMEVTTPYTDRHNDHIQIYVRENETGKLTITDDGYIINDLKMSGCDINTPKRKLFLQNVLNGLGVKNDGSILYVESTLPEFPLKKHSLVQAMLAINDLFYTSKPHVSSLFLEDVSNWLTKANVRYIDNVKFSGKSGYDHFFNFVIPSSTNQPERIVQALNSPDKNNVELFLFAWTETKDTRRPNTKAYTILNDTQNIVQPSVIDALRQYDVVPIEWANKRKYEEELAA